MAEEGELTSRTEVTEEGASGNPGKRDPQVLSQKVKKMSEMQGAKEINDEDYLISRERYMIIRDREVASGDHSKMFKVRDSHGKDHLVKIMPYGKLSIKYKDNLKHNSIKIMRYLIKANHENVIQFYEIYSSPVKLYIFSEHFKGKNYEDSFRKTQLKEDILKIGIKEIVSALNFLYENAIGHRNMGPSNVLISEDRTNVKIVGFGSSMLTWDYMNAVEIKCKTKENFAVNIAPEALAGDYDPHQADVWGLGVLMVYAVTSKYPFSKKTKDHLNDYKTHLKKCLVEVSDEMLGFLDKIFITDPTQRATCGDLMVNHWLAH